MEEFYGKRKKISFRIKEENTKIITAKEKKVDKGEWKIEITENYGYIHKIH